MNRNRVYALNRGQYYFQVAPINITNPTGTLTICGIASTFGTTKPVILITPVNSSNPVGSNITYGSIKMDGVHFQGQQTNNTTNAVIWYCGTQNRRPQQLTINNCLFEFCSVDLFDCTNETGAIGGWPYGAKFFITSSYFRNFFYPGQWWGSRVFQCKHPIDTCWIENCTVTTGGLTFLQQNQLMDFLYFNHNTLVNQHKYWMLSPYRHFMFVTNNIFINQNWVGEDTNVTNSGSSPDRYLRSTILLDTNNVTNGLAVPPKYWVGGDSTKISPLLGFSHMRVYVSDNINYYDPLLINGYYNSSKYVLPALGTIPSYLNWAGAGSGPWRIQNIPCEWMNSRTKGLFNAFGPPNGGLIERRTSTADPGTLTPGIADASVVDSMAVWNQNQWGDPRFPTAPAMTKTKYIYGDYDPKTLPGIFHGVKTDTMTTGAAGITKFTDLTENFSQSVHISAIDGLPIGSLIWDDAKFAAFNSATDFALVWSKYVAEDGLPLSVESTPSGSPVIYGLAQNYPNPFNPTTSIRFGLPARSHVVLAIFNTLGQLVATLVNENEGAGYHEVRFDAGDLASGVYFYRLSAGNGNAVYTSVRKMILLR